MGNIMVPVFSMNTNLPVWINFYSSLLGLGSLIVGGGGGGENLNVLANAVSTFTAGGNVVVLLLRCPIPRRGKFPSFLCAY